MMNDDDADDEVRAWHVCGDDEHRWLPTNYGRCRAALGSPQAWINGCGYDDRQFKQRAKQLLLRPDVDPIN